MISCACSVGGHELRVQVAASDVAEICKCDSGSVSHAVPESLAIHGLSVSGKSSGCVSAMSIATGLATAGVVHYDFSMVRSGGVIDVVSKCVVAHVHLRVNKARDKVLTDDVTFPNRSVVRLISLDDPLCYVIPKDRLRDLFNEGD